MRYNKEIKFRYLLININYYILISIFQKNVVIHEVQKPEI
jgi:hypothetical protein